MTREQYVKIQALSRCRFLPGSFAKRFTQNMHLKSIDDELSEKQAATLDATYYHYRNQISALGIEHLPKFENPEDE